VLTSTVSLLLPARCASCGRPSVPLCAECAAPLRGPARPHSPRPRPPGLPPLWTATTYGGTVRDALVAYKERGRRDLADQLAAALALAVCAALSSAGWAREHGIALVPVPSRHRAARQRGGDHVLRLGAIVARLFGSTAVVCPVLRPIGRMPDAAGLTAARRLATRAGSLVTSGAQSRWLTTSRRPPPVVLLDDLVTTGATLAAAAEVLRGDGVRVTATAVVAATERNHREGLF
jgi:predicted amidophosphoribosyltransferase